MEADRSAASLQERLVRLIASTAADYLKVENETLPWMEISEHDDETLIAFTYPSSSGLPNVAIRISEQSHAC